jgi:hypothetical protein
MVQCQEDCLIKSTPPFQHLHHSAYFRDPYDVATPISICFSPTENHPSPGSLHHTRIPQDPQAFTICALVLISARSRSIDPVLVVSLCSLKLSHVKASLSLLRAQPPQSLLCELPNHVYRYRHKRNTSLWTSKSSK